MKYAIVIEKAADSNYGAYAPDVDGCVATGDSIEEVTRLMQEALAFHFKGMREDGDPIPEPATQVAYVEVSIVRHR
jgi:predicted RNase H-like HicB family nuclease